MPYIQDKGSPNSEVWVIIDKPLSGDIDRGYVYSSGLGYMFDKMLREAGIYDYYVTCHRPDSDNPNAHRNIDGNLSQYQPKIIIPIGAIGGKHCTELVPARRGKNYNPETDSEIHKYCGSLLTSPYLNYKHYVVPLIGPEDIAKQYKLRDQIMLDLLKIKCELNHIKDNGTLQPLPQRKLKYEFESFDEILYIIDSFNNYKLISNDIETIYPRKGTKTSPSTYYGKHPGYPITVGLAPSKDFGISVNLFRESISETRELWRKLDQLFRNTAQLGQNFFNFDLCHYEALGFNIDTEKIQDTLVRHHILWPELPHKLQHLTRQYTREPYYKDEGQGWSVKNMDRLKRYNCLDVCVTYEVWEAQEEEFEERKHLR